MTIPTATKNAVLDALTFVSVKAHSAHPGATGANLIAGQTAGAASVAAASGGQRTLASQTQIILPACTVTWLGWYDGSDALIWATPNGGATPKNFTSLSGDNYIYSEAHGYANDDPVTFHGGTPPSPLVVGAIYYVTSAEADRFKVAATAGGAAIDLTSSTPYAAVVSAITEKTYTAAAIHTVSSATFMVPN